MITSHLQVKAPLAATVKVVPLSRELIPAVARLQQQAFAGYLNARLGLRYQRAFIRWFYEAKDAIALVAMSESEGLLGYVVGAPIGYGARLNRAIFWPAVTSILLRPWLFLDGYFRHMVAGRVHILIGRGQTPTSGTPALPTPTYSLVGIGVLPEARGQGIGAQLVSAFEVAAVAQGARSVRLSIYPHNTTARRLYEKQGWQAQPNPSPAAALYYYKILNHA